MDEDDFEGSMILESLASVGLVDDFFEAVDSDDMRQIISLLRRANVDDETIEIVLKKIEDAD